MDKALQTMINNMPEKTGKALDDWKKILRTENFAKHSEAVKFLKEQHGVTHGFANTIVALSKENPSADLVENQYKGKETLVPLYEKILTIVTTFGTDVSISPKKGSVSLRRKHQFALIKPATKKRIDLGLKLKDVAITDRLENSGPFGTMCTHRVRLHEISEIDEELISWLKTAYEKGQ